MRQYLILISAILSLSACTTVPVKTPTDSSDRLDGPIYPDPDIENPGVIIIAEPVEDLDDSKETPAPPAPVTDAPEIETVEVPAWYSNIPMWSETQPIAAFAAFKRSCESFAKADPDAMLNPHLLGYGRYKDWNLACESVDQIQEKDIRAFFEREFAPLAIKTKISDVGMLTGYYEPEISVKRKPDAVFSEPILAKPESEANQTLPRSRITAATSRVIAYGRPIDVFFMQIQGSGRLKYTDGLTLRAAYGGNNGYGYKSIGKILVARGEMTLSEASKQAIEDWMNKAGPEKTRALMNENPRYIFFAEQKIIPGEGPNGAMRLPLTAMGSIAVDPRYHPYGTLVWLNSKLPQTPGDYNGVDKGILVVAQDTGNAIRGPLRADLFFGSGDYAGTLAGVMKHDVKWTILVPKALVENDQSQS